MIGAIEQAIIARVKAASDGGVLGYQLASVESYAGQLDGEIVEVLRQSSPAVWVAFADERRIEKTARGPMWQARYTVACYARSGRNAAERRLGSADTVGAYQLVQDCKQLLDNQTLDLEITPIAVQAARALFNGQVKGLPGAVYAIDLVTTYEAVPPVAADGLDDFTHFHADWDIPPIGNVQPPLPAEEADARDDIHPQEGA
jgi:phage gp37-like protein